MENTLEAPIAKAPQKQNRIPKAEMQLLNISKMVSKRWNSDTLTLLWTTATKFGSCVDSFETSLSARNTKSGLRVPLTKRIAQLDKEINDASTFVKNYLAEKYTTKEAQAHYSKFGIEKIGTAFIIPRDRSKRTPALKTLIKALTTEGFTEKKYGLAFWTEKLAQYTALTTEATETDGSISSEVDMKDTCKKEIRKTLNAIVNLIKANYPDNYEAKLREWGFQKEKY